jgi:hypothetical protein
MQDQRNQPIQFQRFHNLQQKIQPTGPIPRLFQQRDRPIAYVRDLSSSQRLAISVITDPGTQ